MSIIPILYIGSAISIALGVLLIIKIDKTPVKLKKKPN